MYIQKFMGQLQNPVEMLKNYPSVNLFLGVIGFGSVETSYR